MLRYCPNRACSQTIGCWNASFCERCGTDMTPCIQCLCGQEAYNPRDPDRECHACHEAFTEAYLAKCMSAQLKGLLAQVAEKWSRGPG